MPNCAVTASGGGSASGPARPTYATPTGWPTCTSCSPGQGCPRPGAGRLRTRRTRHRNSAGRLGIGRGESLEKERTALLAELRRGSRTGGRSRPLGSSSTERARKTVTSRLRESSRRLEAVLPELGTHLDRSVITRHLRSNAQPPLLAVVVDGRRTRTWNVWALNSPDNPPIDAHPSPARMRRCTALIGSAPRRCPASRPGCSRRRRWPPTGTRTATRRPPDGLPKSGRR